MLMDGYHLTPPSHQITIKSTLGNTCFNLTLNFANVCRLCMQTKPALLCLFSENETPERAMPLRCKIASLAPSVKVSANAF